MNVLTVLCSGGWMPGNLSEGWKRMGWNVHEFLYGSHMGKTWSPEGLSNNKDVNKGLLETARRLKADGRLDLIFAVIYDDVLAEETARDLRALGVPMVNYHVDLVGQWYRVLRTGRFFDRLACAQRDHWPALQRHGIRPFYMPMAANPTEDTRPPQAYEGVLYLGSPWSYRLVALSSLHASGVPLRIYGNGWPAPERVTSSHAPDPSKAQPLRKNLHDVAHYFLPRLREEGLAGLLGSARLRLRRPQVGGSAAMPAEVVHGAYSQADFAPLVRGASINLGFTHFKGIPGTAGERRQLRLRDFEIPMAGGFYLAQDCAQLRELFQVGTHVGRWSDVHDLVERCREHLADREGRQRMAAAARAHCLKHHTWTRRFSDLLHELGIQPATAPS